MSVIIKTAPIKYKNDNGEYVSTNALTEEKTETVLTRIEDKGGEILSAFDEKKKELDATVAAAEAAAEKFTVKQDKLTAGENITISEDNVISATGGSGEVSDELKAQIEANTTARHMHENKSVLDSITETQITEWNGKQSALTAGDNITIINGVISATVPTTKETLRIVSQPSDIHANINDSVSMTVGAVGDGLSYVWYYLAAGTTSWKTTSVTGYKTSTISFDVTTARIGNSYRCKITDSDGNTVTSNAGTLYLGYEDAVKSALIDTSTTWTDDEKSAVWTKLGLKDSSEVSF